MRSRSNRASVKVTNQPGKKIKDFQKVYQKIVHAGTCVKKHKKKNIFLFLSKLSLILLVETMQGDL